jgi:hypothetical protein
MLAVAKNIMVGPLSYSVEIARVRRGRGVSILLPTIVVSATFIDAPTSLQREAVLS